MSTAAQILANQKNAALSTGPRTPQGKAVSSRNALRFGLTSQQIVLPGENPADFEALHAGLASQLQPATDLECMLLDDIAAAEWRFRRVESVQNAFTARALANGASAEKLLLSDEIRKFQKYAGGYRRERESAWRKLTILQKDRKAEAARRHAEALEALREQRLPFEAIFDARHPGKTYREPDLCSFKAATVPASDEAVPK